MTKPEESEFVRKTRESMERAFSSTEDQKPQLVRELLWAGEDPAEIRNQLQEKLNDLLKKHGVTLEEVKNRVDRKPQGPGVVKRIADGPPPTEAFVDSMKAQMRRAFEQGGVEELMACDPQEKKEDE